MRILYHHRIVSKDGQYVHLTELVNSLKSNGHIIELVGPKFQEQNNSTSKIQVETLKNKLPGHIYELLEFCYSAIAYFRLVKAIKRFQPDIIYERYNLFSPAGIWASKRYSIPLLLEVNAPLYSERAKFSTIKLNRLALWSEKYVWKNASKVLVVTNVLASIVKDSGVESSKIEVIPNAIDMRLYEKRKINLPCDEVIPKGAFILGFVGYFREWHGVDRLVHYIAENSEKNIFLLIVGDGPSRNEIEVLCKDNNITNKVLITGVVARELIPQYIKRFSIAVQPNVVFYASPLKLFEYMAAECAIVAPELPNIKEILSNRDNALLFDQTSTDSLFSVFDELYSDKELRNKLGKNAKNTIVDKSLTWDGNARRVESIAKSELNK